MDKSSNCARVLLADDHAEFLAFAAQLIELEPDFEVVRTFSSGQAIVDEAAALHPDLLVLDISMPGLTGIEAARLLRAIDGDAKIVFLTVHDDQDYLHSALSTGALGYILKDRLATDLAPGLREALAGRQFISHTRTLDQYDRREPASASRNQKTTAKLVE